MKKVLFIRPDTREDGKIWWCESGNDRVEYLTGWSALSELSCHPLSQQVCLLLPASETIFRHFTLPKKDFPPRRRSSRGWRKRRCSAR